MSKRLKIVTLSATLCICLSLLLMGVFAVTNLSFNASSSLNYEVLANVNYFTYSTDNSQLTGLSETYLNLETKPETLYLPSVALDGTIITSIQSGTSETPTFDGLESSEVIVPESVTTIGDYAFYYNNNLTSISMPGVIEIGERAFHYCQNLTRVEMPNVVTILRQAFNNTRINELNIPNVESIGEFAFFSCTNLKELTLPKLTAMGQTSFGDCSNLLEINLPIITETSSNAFMNCSSLTTINFPNINKIGDSCFVNCTSLRRVSIPASITEIGISAFYECSGLYEVFVYAVDPPSLGYRGFPTSVPIKVPAESVSAYKSKWNDMETFNIVAM